MFQVLSSSAFAIDKPGAAIDNSAMVIPAFRKALILTGPTASGKTGVGIKLAEHLNAEIVALDSMTLYRGMDIGTAKPRADQRCRVRHHLIDVLDPWERASVAWWLDQAAECCRDIETRGKRALLVGGTPLYLKAVLHGLFEGAPADRDIRRQLMEEAEERGPEALHERLKEVDPETAARLHPHDIRRVVRALEVWQRMGQPISSLQRQWSTPAATVPNEAETARANQVLCLDVPRDELYARIDARVRQMLESGWIDEVRALRSLPHPMSREALQAVGYHEIAEYLDGRLDEVRMIARIQQRSRNLAKRQLSWFRHLPACRFVSKELTFDIWNSTID